MVQKDNIQSTFLKLKNLTRKRITDKCIYELMILINCISHVGQKNNDTSGRAIANKTLGQKEFSMLDPDKNLLTF